MHPPFSRQTFLKRLRKRSFLLIENIFGQGKIQFARLSVIIGQNVFTYNHLKNKTFPTILLAFFIFGMVSASTVEVIKDPITISKSDDFKKVDSSELTPEVVEQILKEYPTSKLAAVYKNSKNQFKLIMVLQSGTRRTVYIDSGGRWFNHK